jgi:hypothetical protein
MPPKKKTMGNKTYTGTFGMCMYNIGFDRNMKRYKRAISHKGAVK